MVTQPKINAFPRCQRGKYPMTAAAVLRFAKIIHRSIWFSPPGWNSTRNSIQYFLIIFSSAGSRHAINENHSISIFSRFKIENVAKHRSADIFKSMKQKKHSYASGAYASDSFGLLLSAALSVALSRSVSAAPSQQRCQCACVNRNCVFVFSDYSLLLPLRLPFLYIRRCCIEAFLRQSSWSGGPRISISQFLNSHINRQRKEITLYFLR